MRVAGHIMKEIETETSVVGVDAMVDPVTGRTTVMLTGVELDMEAVPKASIVQLEAPLTQEVPEMGSTVPVAVIVVMHMVQAPAVVEIVLTPRVRIEHMSGTGAEIEQETGGLGGALHHLSAEGQLNSYFKLKFCDF